MAYWKTASTCWHSSSSVNMIFQENRYLDIRTSEVIIILLISHIIISLLGSFDSHRNFCSVFSPKSPVYIAIFFFMKCQCFGGESKPSKKIMINVCVGFIVSIQNIDFWHPLWQEVVLTCFQISVEVLTEETSQNAHFCLTKSKTFQLKKIS